MAPQKTTHAVMRAPASIRYWGRRPFLWPGEDVEEREEPLGIPVFCSAKADEVEARCQELEREARRGTPVGLALEVLVRLKQTDQRTMISRVKALAPAIQNAGAALLLDGHVELVARGGADGAHLTGVAALEDALPSLKPDRIAGVGGLATRHDSMAAGELGAACKNCHDTFREKD